jgi:hypothetical protein
MTDDVRTILAIVKRIRPLLAGNPAEIQGAVLADLLAMWLAGHHVPGDQRATADLRREVLSVHLRALGELVPVNAKMIGTAS